MDDKTIPCASCGKPVYDDGIYAHVHSHAIPCDDERGETESERYQKEYGQDGQPLQAVWLNERGL